MKPVIISLFLALLSSTCVNADDSAPVLSQAFFDVLRSGDAGKLKEALDGGASPNARNASGTTPLMLAAVYGNLETMALLIQRGADVNAANLEGARPLHRASWDAARVALLLDHGADLKARSGAGNTALILAARAANSHAAVALLLDHGADAKDSNNFGATALMAAAAGGDSKSVELLLAHGAAPNANVRFDRSGFVLGGARTALMWAAFRGDTRIIHQLIDAGADANEGSLFGTPLDQAAWADRTEAARILLEHGAKANLRGPEDPYTPLHWAASSEHGDPSLVTLLLAHGADPNLDGGEEVPAFLGTPQSALMLARRRGETPIVAALVKAGATKATPDRVPPSSRPARDPAQVDSKTILGAINLALPPLQQTSLESKRAFLKHASHQDCVSCHNQYLPMAALGLAKKQHATIDADAERQLIAMVRNEVMVDATPITPEANWQPLFHPEPVHATGYLLFALAAEGLEASLQTDSSVHHLALIQGQDGCWFNNIPRPPIQTDDIGATALAVHALQRYPLPGRKAEFAERVDRARRWLRKTEAVTTEGQIYKILGLAWAGESASSLQPLAHALIQRQRADGGWAQLPGLKSDAYATGQAIYALRVGAALDRTDPAIERGLRYLLTTQLEDGTWRVQRRTFPFQPTMDSGFPHGRDSWLSAAGSSWSVMALSLPDRATITAAR